MLLQRFAEVGWDFNFASQKIYWSCIEWTLFFLLVLGYRVKVADDIFSQDLDYSPTPCNDKENREQMAIVFQEKGSITAEGSSQSKRWNWLKCTSRFSFYEKEIFAINSFSFATILMMTSLCSKNCWILVQALWR